MNPDIRWKQRFQNYSRALTLLREAIADAVSFQVEKEGNGSTIRIHTRTRMENAKRLFGSKWLVDESGYAEARVEGSIRRGNYP